MTRKPVLSALLGLLSLSACASAPAQAAPRAQAIPALSLNPLQEQDSAVLNALPTQQQDPAAASALVPVGWAAGRALSLGQLLSEWHRSDPNSLWLVLEKLVTARLADAEAERMALHIAPEAVALRFDEEQRRLGTLLEQEGLSLSAYARQEYGQSPELFMQALRNAVLRQMLIERTTRAWVLSSPWLRLRMIVVEGSETMQELRARLDQGEDFASLAAEYSQDGSGPEGGLVPFLVREEESPLSRRAFSQEPGIVGEPFLHKGLEVLVRVEARHEARMKNDWASLGPEVEASLLEFPITDSEFGHWKVSMEKRYPIDVEPLLHLLGVESSG